MVQTMRYKLELKPQKSSSYQVECLSFNFSMQRDGAIKSLSIFQKDSSEETAGGQNELLWQLQSSQVAGDGWQQGMLPIRAHTVQDVIQNYTVGKQMTIEFTRMVFQLKIFTMGTGGKGGWAAVDELSLVREECAHFLPPEASPSTTTPSQSSTIPPDEDLGCTFQDGLCGFQVDGDGGFLFQRSNGSEVPAIGSDHNYDEAGVFLYAESPAVQDPTPVRIRTISRNCHKCPTLGVHLHYFTEH